MNRSLTDPSQTGPALSQGDSSPLVSQYAEFARERKIGEIEENGSFSFVVLDGETVTSSFGAYAGGYTYPKNTTLTVSEIHKRFGQIGKYDANNSVIAFINHKGQLCVCMRTSENEQYLKNNGYQRKSMHVPLSNGESIANPELQMKWQQLQEAEGSMGRWNRGRKVVRILSTDLGNYPLR